MSSLRLSPAHVAAFARHREALALCRRFGNIARFRARALRDKLKPLDLVRCGDRFPHLGVGEFEGFVLTPPLTAGDTVGMGPEFAGLIVFGGVCLRTSLVPGVALRDPDVPELQVGVLLKPMASIWPQCAALLGETLAGLEADGFECRVLDRATHPDLQWLRDLAGSDDDHDDPDFDMVDESDIDAEELDTSDWVDIEDDDDEDAGVAATSGVPGGLLWLRRLPLDRLPPRCGPIVTRFFTGALAPLLDIPAPCWQLLILARDTHDELGEEE